MAGSGQTKPRTSKCKATLNKCRDTLNIGRHWLNWLLTLVIVVIGGVFLLPLVRGRPSSVHEFFNSLANWQRVLFIFALCVLFVYTTFDLLSPRLAHLKYWSSHPPMWLAWLVGILFVGILDLFVGLNPQRYRASLWDWLGYGGGSLGLVATYKWLSHPRAKVSRKESATEPVNPTMDTFQDWAAIEQWLAIDSPATYDFLNNQLIAQRLAVMMISKTRSVGIVGPFGAGKTSLVNWIKDEAEVKVVAPKERPDLLFSKHNCWGFEDSTSSIQSMLADAVATVGTQIDVFGVRSLPDSYRQTFSAAGQWLDRLSKLLLRKRSYVDQFRSLSDLLADMNARLVFIVEDLDRNNSRSFDIQEVLAFLQQLKTFPSLSFVLTAGLTSEPEIDFAKLCDHIEYLKSVSADQSSALISCLRQRCLSQSYFPHEVLTQEHDNQWPPERWLLLSDHDDVWPPEAIARLLSTPRALRHALGRTYQAWQALFGEVDWDQLFAVSVLRCSAPDAFSFMCRHWHRFKDRPSAYSRQHGQLQRVCAAIQRDWEETIRDVQWDARAARALIDFALPATPEYFGGEFYGGDIRQQGVHSERHWRRAINEVIDRDDVRDQTVACDLKAWREAPSVASQLVPRICASASYSNVWEDLAFQYLGNESAPILLLCEHVLSSICLTEGAAASEDSQGFFAVWRYATRHVDRSAGTRHWLRDQIREAASVSLALVNGLWHYWGSGQYAIVRLEDQAELRADMLQVIRQRLTDASSLSRVIDRSHRCVFYQLVFDRGERGPSRDVNVGSWSWLGPVLLDGIRRGSPTVALEVCSLIATRESGSTLAHPTVDRSILAGVFGMTAGELVNALESLTAQVDEPDRTLISQIVHSARGALI